MGAIVSGSINEKFGYFETNSVLGPLAMLVVNMSFRC
jgi:hypothetical protein